MRLFTWSDREIGSINALSILEICLLPCLSFSHTVLLSHTSLHHLPFEKKTLASWPKSVKKQQRKKITMLFPHETSRTVRPRLNLTFTKTFFFKLQHKLALAIDELGLVSSYRPTRTLILQSCLPWHPTRGFVQSNIDSGLCAF